MCVFVILYEGYKEDQEGDLRTEVQKVLRGSRGSQQNSTGWLCGLGAGAGSCGGGRGVLFQTVVCDAGHGGRLGSM